MGLFKKLKKKISGTFKKMNSLSDLGNVKNWAGDVANLGVRAGLGVATAGGSELLGVGEAVGNLTERTVDYVSGQKHTEDKAEEKEKKASLAAAQAAAKKAADDDYYNRVMKARDAQVAAYMDSQTDLTSDDEALGNYGKTLGSFGETALGGKKKKMYY